MTLPTLKKNKEFNFVYRRGNAFSTANLVAVKADRRSGGICFGFSVSKKVGNSVVRNKLRRRLKEAVRENFLVEKNAGVVFIAKAPAASAEYEVLSRDVKYLLSRHGLLGKR